MIVISLDVLDIYESVGDQRYDDVLKEVVKPGVVCNSLMLEMSKLAK